MIDCDRSKKYTLERAAWCDEAERMLAPCFKYENATADMRAKCEQGLFELVRVNGHSWAILEVTHGMLFIWAYAGRGSVQFIERMQTVARHHNLNRVSFFSFHKGCSRLWKHCNPRMVPTGLPGEVQYVFEVAA